jgi:hypothetical protein
MNVVIKAKALKVLDETANYIESLNTPGAGSRWLDKFLERIIAYAKPNVKYALCRHEKLAKRNYSCVTIKNWVVAFKIRNEQFTIYEIIHGSVLR